jgi:SAM-dependent methyltransferase
MQQKVDWFDSSLGRALIKKELEECAHLVPAGYYPAALQIGMQQHDFLSVIEVGSRFVVCSGAIIPRPDGDTATAESIPVLAKGSALPFRDRSHSLIVMPHVLDFCKAPHAILREVNQVLAPEGYIVITGFNQVSLWGLLRLSRNKLDNLPWKAHYYRVKRVQDWLSLLGFDIVGARMSSYLPPLQNEKWRNKLGFLEKVGDRWWPGFGASYVIVGKKREIASSTGNSRLAWHRFIPAIARPAGGLTASAGKSGKAHLRLVVSN